MGEKRLKASIIIGGLIDGTLRTAITDTRAGFRQIGDALKAASKAQKSLTAECLAFQSAGRNITGITERYDRLKTAIDRATQATGNLRKAEAFKDRMDRQADQMRSMAGRADESDISFLVRLARHYDAIARPAGRKLLFVSRGTSTSASGQAPASC